MAEQHLSILIVMIGLSLYFLGLLGYLSKIKKKQVGLKWLFQNRRPKMLQSVVSAFFFGFLAYQWYYPPELIDIIDGLKEVEGYTIKSARREFVEYQAVLVLIGLFNSMILDIAGNMFMTRTGGKVSPVIEYEQDNGETIRRDK